MSEHVSALVAKHPFLLGLEASGLETIARAATERRFAVGDLLLREGDAAAATYLVVEGRVGLEIQAAGRSQRVATADAGEVVGWSWLAPPSRWHFDARALTDVHAIVLDGDALLTACDRDPALGYALMRRFMRVVTGRLEAVRLQLLDLYAPRGAELPWA